jgi:hypothetical protein
MVIILTTTDGRTVYLDRSLTDDQQCSICEQARDTLVVAVSQAPGHRMYFCGQCLTGALAVSMHVKAADAAA